MERRNVEMAVFVLVMVLGIGLRTCLPEKAPEEQYFVVKDRHCPDSTTCLYTFYIRGEGAVYKITYRSTESYLVGDTLELRSRP